MRLLSTTLRFVALSLMENPQRCMRGTGAKVRGRIPRRQFAKNPIAPDCRRNIRGAVDSLAFAAALLRAHGREKILAWCLWPREPGRYVSSPHRKLFPSCDYADQRFTGDTAATETRETGRARETNWNFDRVNGTNVFAIR